MSSFVYISSMSLVQIYIIILSCFGVGLCSFQSELFSVLQQVKLVTPSEAGLQNIVSEVENEILDIDIDQLLSNPTLTDILEDRVKEIVKANGYPIVVQVPSTALYPIIKKEIENIIVQEIRRMDGKIKITSNRVSVSIPTSGKCANTYRADMRVDMEKKNCGGFFSWACGFFSWACGTSKFRLTAHGCFNFVAKGWTIDIQTVDRSSDFDGRNFFGKIVNFLKQDKINDSVRNAIQQGVDDIDLGKPVNDEIKKEVVAAVDSFVVQFQDIVPTEKITQIIEEAKKSILKVVNTDQFRRTSIQIDPKFLSFFLSF